MTHQPAPGSDLGLSPTDLGNLIWLLDMLDDWLLVAEPATIRELSAYLRSVGSRSSATDVVRQLGRLRSLVSNTTTRDEPLCIKRLPDEPRRAYNRMHKGARHGTAKG